MPDSRTPIKKSSIKTIFVAISLLWSITTYSGSGWGAMSTAPMVLVPICAWLFIEWLLANPSKNTLNAAPYALLVLSLSIVPLGFFKTAWHVLLAVVLIGLLAIPWTILVAIGYDKLSKIFRISEG